MPKYSSRFVIQSFELRHFLRIPRPQLRNNNERQSNCDQEERKELTTGKSGNQARIRFAKIFDHDSKKRVEDEKQAGQNSVRLPHPCPHEPEDREQNDSFE